MLLRYFYWHYGKGLRDAIRIARNFLAFSFHLFSVKELSDSFFAPWKAITFSHGAGILTAEIIDAFFGNVLSRVLGAVARSVVITMGVMFTAAILVFDGVLLTVWIIGPVVPAFLVWIGLQLL